VREGAKGLGPDHAKVPHTSLVWEFREDAVKDVAKKVATEAGDDGLAAFVAEA
jgi:hypothetical protein